MQYIQLRRAIIENPVVGGAPYVATTDYWDTVARNTAYKTQTESSDNDPAELPIGTEVDRWVLPGGKARVVSYAGGGRVTTANAVVGTGGTGTCSVDVLVQPPRGLVTADLNGNQAGPPDGYLKIFGQLGTPPYRLQLLDPTGGLVASATRRTPTQPLEVFNLALGRYTVRVTDADNCVFSRALDVVLGAPDGIPYGVTLEDRYQGNGATGRGTRIIWNPATKTVENYGYFTGGDDDGQFFDLPAGSVVDAYLLDDGVTFRTWRVSSPPLVEYSDEASRGFSSLTLDNIILFNPDTPGATGGAVVEVNATAPPVAFELLGSPQANDTGYFDGLAAGDQVVRVSDAAGQQLLVPFSLRQRYAPRWELAFSDGQGVPLRLELWLRDYVGPVEAIKGEATAVVLKSDGLSSTAGGQGDVPPVVGTSAELGLLVPRGLLQEVVVNDDRYCRVDVYRAGALQFRGYVQPDIYHAPMQAGLQPLSVTATDGLAGLKDTDFLGHVGQRLQGRRPLLNTLLCVLSRCGVALPLAFYVNRRSTEMSDADAPELAATTERAGYWDTSKKEPLDDRTVLDALAQALGGTLCQREGSWQVRSPLEALADAPGRAYQPAGTAAGALLAGAPTGTVQPLRLGAGWGWITASQAEQVRPGWKSLAGTTDAGWVKNAFPAGDVFSDPYAWLDGYAQLRPLNGWVPGLSQSFPLLLVRTGEKGTDHSTQWPPSAGATDTRYLVSPQLPLVPEPEACPAYLTFTAKLVSSTFLPTGQATADAAPTAVLLAELVIDGLRPNTPLTLTIPLAKSATEKETVLSLALPTLPAGSQRAVLYVYPWTTTAIDLLRKNVDGTYGLALFDRKVAYQAGDLVRWVVGGNQRVFQAKKALYPAVNEPGGLPVGTRDWAENTEFVAGRVVIYQGAYFYAKRNLYAPIPVPPATGSDASWLRVAREDIPDDSWQPVSAAVAQGQLLVSSIGVELRPQQATWDAADNFRADGPGGTVRPTEALKVFHPDVPLASGLFEGNRYAFSKAVALADGSLSTAWARTLDLAPSPLFEANVLDALALRSGHSRLLTGTLKHVSSAPPYLLDSVDTPYDVPGRRFFVAATSWNLKLARVEVSLTEIGPGADATDPFAEAGLPDGIRIIDRVYQYITGQYAAYARGTDDGSVRVRG